MEVVADVYQQQTQQESQRNIQSRQTRPYSNAERQRRYREKRKSDKMHACTTFNQSSDVQPQQEQPQHDVQINKRQPQSSAERQRKYRKSLRCQQQQQQQMEDINAITVLSNTPHTSSIHQLRNVNQAELARKRHLNKQRQSRFRARQRFESPSTSSHQAQAERFPTNPSDKNVWIENMKAHHWIPKDPKENDSLCTELFDIKCFEKHSNGTVLKFGSVPTIFEKLDESSALGSSNSNSASSSSRSHSPKSSEMKTLLSDLFLRKYDYQNDANTSEKKDEYKKDQQDAQQIKLVKLGLTNTSKDVKPTLPQKKQNLINGNSNEIPTDKEILNIKVEPLDNTEQSDKNKMDVDIPNTEKVFVKSTTCEGKQSVNGQSRPKIFRLDLPEYPDDYEEQLCEFGKNVAEQLCCLNVEDARMAQMDIIAALSKFTNKIILEPRKSNCMVEIEIQTVNPGIPLVSSKSEVNAKTQSQFSVSQTSPVLGSPVTPVNVLGSPVSQTSPVGLLKTQSRKMVRSKFTKAAVTNVKPISSPVVQLRNTEAILSSPISSTSIGSIPTSPQSSSNIVPSGSLMSQTDFSKLEFCEITVKTESESEFTHSHVNVYEDIEQEQESLNIKYEPQSENET